MNRFERYSKGLLWCLSTFLLAAFVAGCTGSGGAGTNSTGATLSSIAVSSANPSIAIAAPNQFTATATFSDGTAKDITSSVTWSSGTAGVATVNTGGLATGVTAGSSVITATSGGISGTMTLTVTAATLVSIEVTPTTPSIATAATQQFTATGTNSDGTSADLTTSVIWSSGTLGVATVKAAGLATGVTAGSSVITATAGGISGTTTLTVTAATLVSIAVTPANPSIIKGLTKQFTATGTYSDGTSAIIATSITWSSGTAAVATVKPSGLATGIAAGTSVITATSGGKSGNTTLTVTAATLVSIAVTPANPSIAKGLTKQFTAKGTYSDNTFADINALVTWSSGTAGVATVNTSGLATGLAAGTSIITATSGSKSGSTLLTVTALVAKGPAPVSLGTAGNFVILAKTGISTVPTSAITGDIGVSPAAASFVTGFGLTADSTNVFSTSIQVVGKVYAANYAVPTPSNLTTAVGDMQTAYTDAAGRPLPDFTELFGGNISAKTLVPGLYKWGTGVLINTDVTLNGGPNDVWIFQIAGDITQANGTSVILAGGASPKNIFWQVAGGTGVAIGTTAHFEGVILAQKAITLNTGASINGRLLAQSAVTLKSSTVTQPAP